MKVSVEIASGHIKNGIIGNCHDCVLALALRKHMKYDYLVRDSYLVIYTKATTETVPLSLQCQRVIRKFDNGKKVNPITDRGGASVPMKVCRKCPHHIKRQRGQPYPCCAVLREMRAKGPSPEAQMAGMIQGAVEKAKEMIG